MKFVNARPYADPDTAARKIVEIANALEPCMVGRLLVDAAAPYRGKWPRKHQYALS
jgi:hypothetical protein